MNATGNPLHRQKGAILPVVLLLGMGLMTGVAGVVNLGFVQDDLARAEREALNSAISAQYLIDGRLFESARFDNPQGARIPFPSSNLTVHQRDWGNLSCFRTTGTSASTGLPIPAATNSDYISIGKGNFGMGLGTPSAPTNYTIGQITPVNGGSRSAPGQVGTNSFALTQYFGREVFSLRIASGSDNRIELRRLNETAVDRFFAHIWFRLPANLSGLDYLDSEMSIPLLTHLPASSSTQAAQWTIVATTESTGLKRVTLNTGIGGLVSASASIATAANNPASFNEWYSAAIYFDSTATNSSWMELRRRGENHSSADESIYTTHSYSINPGGSFYLGASGALPTPLGASANYPIDIATVRVWLEPSNVSSVTLASSAAEAIYFMDMLRPGGFFSASSATPYLDGGLYPSVTLQEPDSYLTLDSEKAQEVLVSIASGAYLITSAWQPLFGQPIAIGDVTVNNVLPIGGNPDSLAVGDRAEHGGPPSAHQLYLFHACDKGGYKFVQRTRRYTRGAGANDQQVEWLEE